MRHAERVAQIAAFFSHLVKVPGYLMELRALGVNKRGYPIVRSALCDDPVQAAGLAIWMNDRAWAVYFTLNPIAMDSPFALVTKRNQIHKPSRDENGKPLGPLTASAEDIAYRRLLLIDVDPTRALGCEKQCSTDEEKVKAREVATALWAWLKSKGWSPLTWVDSGNGLHGYALLPASAKTEEVQLLLRYLSWRFSTSEARIDTAVTDLPRISRVPLTLNVKGELTDDRPWRMAMILQMRQLVEVTGEQLAALVEEAKERLPRPPVLPRRELDVDEAEVQEFMDQLEEREIITVDGVTRKAGCVYWSLAECPFVGREHEGMSVGAGKTCIVLSRESLGFSCFAGACAGKTFGDFMRLLRDEHGLNYEWDIYKQQSQAELEARWGGIDDIGQQDFSTPRERLLRSWHLSQDI